jgi:hypothetical protein
VCGNGFAIRLGVYIPIIGAKGEIRLMLFVVVRSPTPHAQVGSALFTIRRHFSLFILRAASYIATFLSERSFTTSNLGRIIPTNLP